MLVTEQRQCVLLVAGNLPGLRHQLAMLPHRQPSARFAVAWQFGLEVTRAQLEKGLELVGRGLAAIGLEQNATQALVDGDGRI
ncbi:hypothetical protein D3C80_1956850 [compost metagenome]